MASKDIFKALADDHDKHRTLMEQIGKTSGDSDGRRELFSRLNAELRSHADAEERTLYAEMLGDADMQPDASHSVHEHEQINNLLDELENKEMSDSAWLSTFEDLRERVLHHIDEEEKETFEVGRKHIEEARAEDLGQKFEKEKSAELEAAN